MDLKSLCGFSKLFAGCLLLCGLTLITGCSGTQDPSPNGAQAKGDPVAKRGADLALQMALARKSNSRLGANISGVLPVAVDPPSPDVATLPDKGDLAASDPSRKPYKSGAYLWHPIRLSEGHAFASLKSGFMNLRAPDGRLMKLRYERYVEHESGDWSWIGRVEGVSEEFGNVLITFGPKAVFGEIPNIDRSLPPLKLMTLSGAAWLGETTYDEQKKHPLPWKKGRDAMRTPRATLTQGSSQTNGTPSAVEGFVPEVGSANVSAAATSLPTVDVMLGYTTGFMQALGSHSATVTRLNYVIDDMNLNLARSPVNGRVRLVHTQYVAYEPVSTADRDKTAVALDDLTGYDGRAVPAALQPLRNGLRDQYGADLVGIMVGPGTNAGCGLGWQIQTMDPAHEQQFGFSALAFGCEQAYKHEAGHNMGLAHDRETEGSNPPPGIAPYAYGYRTRQPDGVGFCTPMAYQYDSGTPNAGVYSTPNRTFKGLPTGTANDDNTRALNMMFPIVAQFRATKIFEGRRPRGDVSGDNRSDLVFFNSSARLVSHWRMNANTVLATPNPQSYPAGAGIMATGDFNKDGRSDLAWMLASRRISLWLSNGNGWTGSTPNAPPLAAGWSVVGAADLTGDGKSELLFLNPSARKFTYWQVNGAAVAYGPTYSTRAGDRLVAAGDLNADGQKDIVWQGPDGQLYMWWSNGMSLNTAFTKIGSPLASGFVVLGTGDVDGDGRDDLLLFHPSTARFFYWQMSGAKVVKTAGPYHISSTARLGAIGDYNGDGRADVAWRVSSTGVSMWFSNGALPGTGGAVNRSIPPQWNVSNAGVGGN